MAFVRETTYHVGSTTYKETQYRETNLRPLGPAESQCLKDVFCSSCETTSGKVARLVVCTGTGAAAGGIFFGPPGAAVGGGLGLGIGFCTLL